MFTIPPFALVIVAVFLALAVVAVLLALFANMITADNQPEAEIMTSATNYRYLRSQRKSYDKPGEN